jgi:hypothetical protein
MGWWWTGPRGGGGLGQGVVVDWAKGWWWTGPRGGGGCAFCGVHARVVGRVVKSDDSDGSGVLRVLLEVVADVSTTVLGNQQRLFEPRVVERLPKGLGVRRIARSLVPNANICGDSTAKVDGT